MIKCEHCGNGRAIEKHKDKDKYDNDIINYRCVACGRWTEVLI